jgi:2-oxoglutarate ferredoxin oxidoreductase subunit alpha
VGDPEGDQLVVGWGSTHGAITAALGAVRGEGHRVGHVQLRHLNPLPKNLGEVLKRYRRVLVPELNMGQLAWVLRARYLVDTVSYCKVQGKPFKHAELKARIEELVGGEGR